MPSSGATSGAIRAGRAFVELFADDSKLVRGLRRASRKLKDFGNHIRDLGLKIAAAVAIPFTALGTVTIKAAADAVESMNRFQQVLGNQAKAAGQYAEKLAKKVGRSAVTIKDAMSAFQGQFVGLGFSGKQARQLSQHLEKLSIDFASFNNLSDQDAFERFISAMSGSSEVLDQFGVNIKIAALDQQLLTMGFKASAQGATEQQRALARVALITKAMGRQGAIGDAARTIGSFSNQMKVLKSRLYDASIAIGQALIPAIKPLVTMAAHIADTFAGWAKQNKNLIATIVKVAAGVAAAGVALAALGVAISAVGFVLGGVASLFSLMAAAIGGVITVLGALLSPITLAVAAVGALGAALVYVSDAGGKAVSWLGDRFAELKADAVKAYHGIADALAAADISLAAKILWQALKLEWLKGVNALEAYWIGFKNFFISLGYKAFYGIEKIAANVTAGIKAGWAHLTAFLMNHFPKVTTAFKKAWRSAVSTVTDWMLEIWGSINPDFNVKAAIEQAIRIASRTSSGTTAMKMRHRSSVTPSSRTRWPISGRAATKPSKRSMRSNNKLKRIAAKPPRMRSTPPPMRLSKPRRNTRHRYSRRRTSVSKTKKTSPARLRPSCRRLMTY